MDLEGRIYRINGTTGNTVHVFSPDGEPIGQWGSYGLLPGQFSDATGIAVDEAGLVYVADYVGSSIQTFLAQFD